MKSKVILFVCIIVLCPIMLTSILLINSGEVSVLWNNFAIDSDEKVYVGKKYCIEVYENGNLVNTINPFSSRTYAFTIQNGDTILLSTSSTEYLLDLKGNIINSKEDVGSSTYNRLKKKDVFVSTNGKIYELTNCFGRYSIVCNDLQIYQMPELDYVIKLLYKLSSFMFYVCVIVIIFNTKKKPNKTGDGSLIDG